jgi:subtilisin family serine protease
LSPAIRLILVAAFTLALSATASASTDVNVTRGAAPHLQLAASERAYVPSEVIVQFRANASRAAERQAQARVGARVAQRFPAFRMEVAKVPAGVTVAAAIRRYQADPAVAFAEPNYLRYPTAPPDDTFFSDLWGLDNTGQAHDVSDDPSFSGPATKSGDAGADIDALEAWDPLTGNQMGNGTVIAVLDTGVDVGHPDLANQLWTNPDDPPGNGDNDGNGKIDDVHGWDFADNNATLLDAAPPHFSGYDHGTHVAGTIAAEADNAAGVAGVCPGCEIMVLKIASDADGALPLSAEIAALAYAKAHGVKIANLSFGGPIFSNVERNAIKNSGLLAVVAAGNDSLDNDMPLAVDSVGDSNPDIFTPSYPAAYTLPNILTVAASNDEDDNAYATECEAHVDFTKPECAFTNWGHDSVDVSAPGVDIKSTVPSAGYDTWDGTSMAAPHVAGVAGLVLSENPAYTVANVKNAIMKSVDRPSSLDTLYIAPAQGITGPSGSTVIETGNPFTRTSGRVDAANALGGSTANATPNTDGNVSGATSMSKAQVSGSVAWPNDVNDVRKRKLVKGRTYRITLTVPGSEDYDLWVWKPGSKEIWQFSKLQKFSATVGGADESVKFRAGSTGTYYLHVQAWVRSEGGYTLKIAQVS